MKTRLVFFLQVIIVQMAVISLKKMGLYEIDNEA